MLLQQTTAFQKVQEIYIRQESQQPGGNTLGENILPFMYDGKKYTLWSINLTTETNDNPLAIDPDEFDFDPLFNCEDEDEDFNPDVQESDLHLVICPANAERDGDAHKRFILPIDDPLLDQLLDTARVQWPNLDDLTQ